MSSSRATMVAVRDGPVALAKFLIDDDIAKPNIANQDGQTLLFYAVQNRDCAAEMCELLASAYDLDASKADCRGQTAMFYLAKTKNVKCVETLMRLGSGVHHIDKFGQSPVFYATSSGCIDMIRALFHHGADVNFQDTHGQTPLFYARTKGTLQALLNCGAQLHHRDNFGKTVIEYKTVPPEVHEYAGQIVNLDSVPDRLSWSYCEDGSLYAILSASAQDTSDLCTLENEFIEDHTDMLRPMLPNAKEEELIDQIGLNPDAAARRATIQSISSSKRSLEFLKYGSTLKCVHFQKDGEDSSVPKIVGYVYFKLREAKSGEPPMLVFSHLKVDRRHQGRGCATLLLAGALKHLETSVHQSRTQGVSAEYWTRHMQLSVLEKNGPARALYSKLGFKEEMRHGSPVVWITMVRRGVDLTKLAAQRWLSLVPAPGGACAVELRLLLQGLMDKNSVENLGVTTPVRKRKVMQDVKSPPLTRKMARRQCALRQQEHKAITLK